MLWCYLSSWGGSQWICSHAQSLKHHWTLKGTSEATQPEHFLSERGNPCLPWWELHWCISAMQAAGLRQRMAGAVPRATPCPTAPTQMGLGLSPTLHPCSPPVPSTGTVPGSRDRPVLGCSWDAATLLSGTAVTPQPGVYRHRGKLKPQGLLHQGNTIFSLGTKI